MGLGLECCLHMTRLSAAAALLVPTDYEEEGPGKGRQRGGSRSGASSGGAWTGAQQAGTALAGAQPEVVATDGGTKMRIKINRAGKGAGDDSTPRSGMGLEKQQQQTSGTGQQGGPAASRSPEPVALLSKKLLRVRG